MMRGEGSGGKRVTCENGKMPDIAPVMSQI